MGKRDAKAMLVDDIDHARDTPGAYEFVEHRDSGSSGMAFICPCGCGREGYLPFRPESSPSWQWNGDRQRPTLTPSILQVGGCRWHGYLTAGEFVEC